MYPFAHMVECGCGEFVSYMDYVSLNTKYQELNTNFDKVQAEKEHLEEYTDHLVAFSKLACLPKDLENLRETNTKFAIEIEDLKKSRDAWAQDAERLKKKLCAVIDIINT